MVLEMYKGRYIVSRYLLLLHETNEIKAIIMLGEQLKPITVALIFM